MLPAWRCQICYSRHAPCPRYAKSAARCRELRAARRARATRAKRAARAELRQVAAARCGARLSERAFDFVMPASSARRVDAARQRFYDVLPRCYVAAALRARRALYERRDNSTQALCEEVAFGAALRDDARRGHAQRGRKGGESSTASAARAQRCARDMPGRKAAGAAAAASSACAIDYPMARAFMLRARYSARTARGKQ